MRGEGIDPGRQSIAGGFHFPGGIGSGGLQERLRIGLGRGQQLPFTLTPIFFGGFTRFRGFRSSDGEGFFVTDEFGFGGLSESGDVGGLAVGKGFAGGDVTGGGARRGYSRRCTRCGREKAPPTWGGGAF